MPEHYEHGENPEVDSVLRALRQAGLRYPAYELIWCFISSAKKPLVAARYAKQRMEDGGPYLMVSDWAYIIQSSKSQLHHLYFRSGVLMLDLCSHG
jgi:hypothetical protein